jgi:hypothetical protein
MSGKGSKPRPLSVDRKTFNDNWDKIFSKKELTKEEKKKYKELHDTFRLRGS